MNPIFHGTVIVDIITNKIITFEKQQLEDETLKKKIYEHRKKRTTEWLSVMQMAKEFEEEKKLEK